MIIDRIFKDLFDEEENNDSIILQDENTNNNVDDLLAMYYSGVFDDLFKGDNNEQNWWKDFLQPKRKV